MAATCAGLEIQAKPSCDLGWLLLVLCLGPLSKRYGGWGLAVICLIRFRKLWSMRQDHQSNGIVIVNSLGEPQIGWDRASEDLQGWANSVSQADEVSGKECAYRLLWLCGSVALRGRAGRDTKKRENGFCPPACVSENYPPTLPLMPDTLVPPCMPLVPFKLLSRC